MNRGLLVLMGILGLLAAAPSGPAAAAGAAEGPFVLVIENHRFQPQTLSVPAGRRIEFVVENRDATAEEFESHDLRREKVIPGKSRVSVWVGPLPAGTYAFVGEFHEATARGTLIAK